MQHGTQWRWGRLAGLALAGASLFGQDSAWAQAPAEQDAAGPRVLESVLVTARRHSENVMAAPIAVSTLDTKDMEELGVTGFDRLGQTVPNLNVQYRFGPGTGPLLSLRGEDIGTGSFQTDVRGVLYLDDANTGHVGALSVFSLANLCGMEVVRGPQGALYGSNAAAGVIRLKTCEPAGTPGASLTLGTGNLGHAQASFALDSGKHGGLAVRLVVQHEENKGWVRNETPGLVTRLSEPIGTIVSVDDFGSVNADAVAVRARYFAAPALTLDYSFDWTRRQSTQPALQVLALYGGFGALFDPAAGGGGTRAQLTPRDSVAANLLAPDKLRTWGQSLGAEYRFSPSLSLRYILSTRQMWQLSAGNDIDGAALNGNFLTQLGIATPAEDRVCMICTAWLSALHQSTHELRLRSKRDGLDMSAGLSSFREIVDWNTPAFIGGRFQPDGVNEIGSLGQFLSSDYIAGEKASAVNSSEAIFGQMEFEPWAGLALSGGLRWTHDRRSAQMERTARGVYASAAAFSYADWELAARQQLAPGLNAYARLSTAHISGGTLGGQSFAPEVDHGVELGLKFEGLQHRLRGSLAVFRTRVSHLQMQGFSLELGGLPVDGGSATKTGFEAEVQAQLLPALRLHASYGHIRDQIGNGFTTLAPTQTAYLGADYQFARLGNGALPSWRIDASWRDRTAPGPCLIEQSGDGTGCHGTGDLALTQAVTLPARVDLSTRLSLDEIPLGGRVLGRLSFWVRNLLDNRKLQFARDLSNGIVVGTFTAPRTLGVEFTAQY